ncbi:MAG TPA: hypothetical protein EYG46_20815 [Myxococcales bacterium]|nr:hypothetical protein [Myxococcales bacterium]
MSQIYRNPRIHREQGQVLDSFHPDVAHVQHLMGLSVDLPALAQARGVPVAMTVHDAWLQYATGGQRFRRSLGRCDEVSLERCGECTAHLSTPAMQVNALRDRMGVRVGAPIELSSLDAASGSAIPARARSMDCPVLSRQSFQGSREFNPPYNVSASSPIGKRCSTWQMNSIVSSSPRYS